MLSADIGKGLVFANIDVNSHVNQRDEVLDREPVCDEAAAVIVRSYDKQISRLEGLQDFLVPHRKFEPDHPCLGVDPEDIPLGQANFG